MQVATPNSAISSSTTSSPSVAVAVAVAASLGAGPPGPDSTYTQLILDHPLYPLLEMVFQKCELATSSPRDSQADSICSSDSFSEDIRNFISTARMRNEQLTTGCHDVDKFMLKSIEVLRIHLQELEKVHQLCDNFCTRYINCLKGKLPIDLVVDDGSSRDTNSTSRNGQQDGGPSSNNTTPNNSSSSTNQNTSTSQNGRSTASNSSSTTTTTTTQQQQNNGHHHSSSQQHHSNTNHHHPHQQSHHDIGAGSNGYPTTGDAAAAAAAAYHQSYGAYGPTGYAGGPTQNPYAAAQHAAYAASAAGLPHYQTPSDHHSSIKLESSNANHHLHHHPHHRELTASSGSSSASSVKEHGGGANGGQYGTETNSATTAPDRQLHDDIRSPTGSTGSFLGDASLGSGDGTECEDDDNRGRRQQKKRGIFPKAATNIMRAWLFNHLSHPYPSEDQKKQLAEETGLTILQVNNWFINARRRIVQPMIDHSNRSGNMMAGGPAYSPDGGGMGYMLDPSSQSFRSLSGVDSAGMNPLAASHAAMTSAAMGAYSAASAQHLSQYNRQQQSHAAMLGLSTPPTGPHMMGAHPTLPPHDYY